MNTCMHSSAHTEKCDSASRITVLRFPCLTWRSQGDAGGSEAMYQNSVWNSEDVVPSTANATDTPDRVY